MLYRRMKLHIYSVSRPARQDGSPAGKGDTGYFLFLRQKRYYQGMPLRRKREPVEVSSS